MYDEQNLMRNKQRLWAKMKSQERKDHIKMLWGKARKGVRGSMFLQRLHEDKAGDVKFLAG